MSEFKYVVTINNGLERISQEEIYRLTGKRPSIGNNILRFNGSEEDAYRLIIWGRTIHRVLLLIDEGVFSDLDDLKVRVQKINLKPYYKDNLSFALKTSRYGEHSFTSLDVNRVIGGAIYDNLKREGFNPHVNLKNPDIQFIMRIVGNSYMLTINLTGESLHVRSYRVYNHPASIKTSIASAMVLMSRWRDEDFIDPMAGGGTIPIEAAMSKYRFPPGIYREKHPLINIPLFSEEKYLKYREESLHERIMKRMDINIIYNDISSKYMEGALKNASSAGVKDFISFYNIDARRLSKHNIDLRDGFIAISNPPYGIRITRHKVIPSLYQDIINELISLGCKRVIMITAAWKHLLKAYEENDVKLVEMIKVKHGHLDTFILHGECK